MTKNEFYVDKIHNVNDDTGQNKDNSQDEVESGFSMDGSTSANRHGFRLKENKIQQNHSEVYVRNPVYVSHTDFTKDRSKQKLDKEQRTITPDQEKRKQRPEQRKPLPEAEKRKLPPEKLPSINRDVTDSSKSRIQQRKPDRTIPTKSSSLPRHQNGQSISHVQNERNTPYSSQSYQKYPTSEDPRRKKVASDLRSKDENVVERINSKSSNGNKFSSKRNRHKSEGDNQSARFQRSKSSDAANHRQKSKVPIYNDYSPLSSDESQITDTTRLVSDKRKTKSLQHFKTFYDMQSFDNRLSMQRFSRHQKYFYSSDDSSDVSVPLRSGYKTDNSLPGSRNGTQTETSVNMDGIDEYSFPALEGYRKHGLKHSFPSAPFKRLKQIGKRNICVAILGSVLSVIGAFLLFCPSVAILLVVFPICLLFKTTCLSCSCTCNRCCEFGVRLTSKERSCVGSLPESTTIYQCLLSIEFGLDIHRIRDLINARLICAEDRLKHKLYPKFSMKIAQTCVGLVWVPDHSFAINNHVYNMPRRVENYEELQEYVSESSSKPLSIQNLLWEVQVLKNFGDHRDTVLFVRFHPVLSDGISLVHLVFASLTDVDAITSSVPKFSSKRQCINALKAMFCAPFIFVSRYLCSKSDFNLLHGNHSLISGKRVVSWSDPYSLEEARRVCQVTRSSLNEVLLSVATGTLRTYLQFNGIEHPYNMQVLVPVHYRSGSSKFKTENNQALFLSLPIPTNTEGAIPRLWKVKAIMSNVKHTALFTVTRCVKFITSYILPNGLYSKLWARLRNKCSCIVSNIPGPEGPIRFGSRLIKECICWMPPHDNIAISLTFITFDDHIRMAVMADRAVLPNPELLSKQFAYQMSSLSELLANRRIPGEQVAKRIEALELECEIHAEPTVEQLQHKMSLIQQELQDLKIQLETEGRHKHTAGQTKILKKIDSLKEQFRELLVESRQRRAAEQETAVILSEDDPEDDLDDDGEIRRPFRRRTLSISSRLSTLSTSSTVRPLAAPATPFDLASEIDSESEASFRMDGISQISRNPQHRRQLSENPQQFEILEYASSPSFERKMRTF